MPMHPNPSAETSRRKEASTTTIRRAHAVHPITAVQLEWSSWSRDVEEEVIPTCRALDLAILAGWVMGHSKMGWNNVLFHHFHNIVARQILGYKALEVLPRLQGENFDHNKLVFEQVNEMAQKKGCTLAQLALAWVLHQGDDVCPIPGTTKIQNLNQNLGALSVKLTAHDMAELESMATFKGARMPEQILAHYYKNADTPPLSSWKSE
ncbi:hypothetical protein L1987_04552 [Smallanthus sonchifolius]|uniref:Uncharacterized protein n=1 Tax=Smallanthus sonchifolius TaxID=185202 RepID=A0ACB9JSW8_9ASTR|nr:hypothetical protein L1987_04552 [Smallanthus sonchifolius]